MPGRPPRWPFAILSGLFVGLVFWSSSSATGEYVDGLPGPSVNALHIPSGMVLAILLLRALVAGRGWRSPESWPGLGTRSGAMVLAAVLAHGLFNEIHQFGVPGRYCAVSDILLDGSGAVIALCVPLRGAVGRPLRWTWACSCAVGALGLAFVAASVHLPGDRFLADLLDAVTR
jgi:hypothetical protein